MNHIQMLDQLSKNWGWIVLRGVAGVIFGVLAFAWPGITLVVLTLFFGAYALTDGIFALVAAYRRREGVDFAQELIALRAELQPPHNEPHQ